jgi:hypothetical protein
MMLTEECHADNRVSCCCLRPGDVLHAVPLALRAFAIASNVLFIVYAAGSDLAPILLLHALLLPINVWSLRRLLGSGVTIGRRLSRSGQFATGV